MSSTATNEKPETSLQDQLASVGKPVWLALMVIGFVFWWPVGLAILAYLAWTGRLGGFAPRWWGTRSLFGSGNAAFDEHRADMLREIDAEAARFRTFREKVARAKDKSELDAFMAEQSPAKKRTRR